MNESDFFTSSTNEHIPKPNIQVESEFRDFVPEEFSADPLGYFEREGINIKSGEVKIDETGVVREDPTAVKDLPHWKNLDGEEIAVVGKRVNATKAEVAKSANPFYEYEMLQWLEKMNLPAARPIAKAEQDGVYIIVSERIPGIRWSEKDSLSLKEKGYSETDVQNLMIEAEEKMSELKEQFEASGVSRTWKLKDMVFQIDVENRKIISLVPTDWERTRIIEQE